VLVIVKVVALLLTPFFLFGLELTVEGGKENNQPFSIIHIKDKKNFLCERIRNDFDQTVQVICAFSQRPSQSLRPINNNFFKISFATKGSHYFITITPHKKMKLYPMIFDLKEKSNSDVRKDKLIEYATLKAQIKATDNQDEKIKKSKELHKLSKLLGLGNNETNI
jgi:hypothetical protein